jgi:hypothetical protein
MIPWLVASAALLAACTDRQPEATRPGYGQLRSPFELQRIKAHPQSCDSASDCPTGSRCDTTKAVCDWDCMSDSDCDHGQTCDAVGSCVASFTNVARSNDSAACASSPVADRRKALVDLASIAPGDQKPACETSDDCACGARCSKEAGSVCVVECMPAELATPPPPPELELTCTGGNVCSQIGQCIAPPPNVPPPPPTFQLNLEVAPGHVSANTAVEPKLVETKVRVVANDFTILTPTHSARVVFKLGRTGSSVPEGTPKPRVKCASTAELGEECAFDGGWTFDISHSDVHSQWRSIWIEIPHSATPADWTFEARSEYAALATPIAVEAASLAIPTTDPGHYRGTISFANAGAGAQGDNQATLFVEADVTATHVAVFEAQRVLFPAGYVVVPRAASAYTTVPWLQTQLASSTATYDVQFRVSSAAYDQTTGHLDATLSYLDGTGSPATPLTLSLDRTGDVAALACTADAQCGANAHCETATGSMPGMGRCMPGTTRAGTESNQAGGPASTMTSRRFDDWQPTLTSLASSNSTKLSGSDVTGFERAYCFDTAANGASRFAASENQQAPSNDLLCTPGGAGPEYAQPTFSIANRTKEHEPANGFDLFQSCLADLGAPPSTDAPLGAKPCVSLARFFLALRANVVSGVGQPMKLSGQRRLGNMLRQWLSTNAYTATTAVQLRKYDDALANGNEPANERLGKALDVVDDGLRVLLDPQVRGQYRTGPDLPLATTTPDYRVPDRPVVRWSFNGDSPALATEGTNQLSGTNTTVPITFPDAALHCGSRDFVTSQPTAFGAGYDDARFTVMGNFVFTAYMTGLPSTTFATFATSSSANSSNTWSMGSRTDGAGTTAPTLRLTMSGPGGAFVTFPAISALAVPDPGRDANWGLMAIVADSGSYHIYRYRPGNSMVDTFTGTSSTAPVRLLDNGTLGFPCMPGPKLCVSWDRYLQGDGLGASTSSFPETFNRTANTAFDQFQCPIAPPTQAFCNTDATQRRNALVPTIAAGVPAAVLNAFTVTSGPISILGSNCIANETGVASQWSYSCPFSINSFPSVSILNKPSCGSSDGSVPFRGDIQTYDELSLWKRAITADDFKVMAARYNGNPNNDILPPPPSAASKSEQATALPVHIVETAAADLQLLTEYVEAERQVLYGECYLDGTSEARDRALARAGRNLRLVAVLEHEAAALAALPGASSALWYERYQAARQLLAGRRTSALHAIDQAAKCTNPTNVPEDDVPLYTGDAGSAVDKFFAASTYLVGKARAEIALATAELIDAQNAYRAQRDSDFQANLESTGPTGTTLREQRMAGLKAEHEGALRRLCGAPASGTLLDGFLNGTLTADNCFFKKERPECSGAESLAIRDIPATCLKGDLGAQVLAIQGAEIDGTNAQNAGGRALVAYDTQFGYCDRQVKFHDETESIMTEHLDFMRSLRDERQSWGMIGSFLSAASNVAAAVAKHGEGAGNAAGSVISFALQTHLNTLDNRIADAEVKHQIVLTRRQGTEQEMACYNQADLMLLAVDSANDVIKRSALATDTATASLDNAREITRAMVDEAAGQIAIEARIDRAPPQFHYWLDQHIEQFQRHMTRARQLTYLAVRAFEYEYQGDLGFRSDTLAARVPDDLLTVLSRIEAHNSPLDRDTHPNATPVVLSLVDELLELQDLTQPSVNLPPGVPRLTKAQQLRQLLKSDASKIYDGNHNPIGHGVRFSLRPGGFATLSCAERVWRVTTSVQITNGVPNTFYNMGLYQANAFASQQCQAPVRGTLTFTRTRPSNNLMVGDVAADLTKPDPLDFITVNGPVDMMRGTLFDLPEDGHPAGFSSGFAGRGLYGDYLLLFPTQFTDAVIDTVEDVLIRFDFLEVANGL